MSDKKISQLTAATTPLAGTEVLPIVQSAATVKVATDDLTVKNVRSNATSGILQIVGPGAGTTRTMTTPNTNFTAARTDAAQSFTGDQTLSTGNLVIGTAGKGIDFSVNSHAAGMTSELLNWYEEGTWTPTDASGAGLSLTITYAKYVRIGKSVTINAFVTYPATASTAAATIGGLPFSVASNNYPPATFASNSGTALSGFGNATAKTISIGTAADYATAVANSTLSGKNLVISLTYLVD